jgi:FixJ family two-component response regulator
MAEGRGLIAVVDDDESVRRALKRLLRSADFEVQTYASGPEFLSAFESQKPDYVILDIHMPGMTGFDVQRALAIRHSEVPVIIITALHNEEDEARALRAGAARVLRKPVKDELLLDALHGLATSRHLPC